MLAYTAACMVKEDMKERLPSSQTTYEKVRRGIATGALSLSLLPIVNSHDSQPDDDVLLLKSLEPETGLFAQLSIQTLYQYDQPNDGANAPLFDMLPAEHSSAFKRAINDPLVQLAIRTGDVNQIRATKNNAYDDPFTGKHITSHDDGYFETLDIDKPEQAGKIVLGFGVGSMDFEQRVFTDDYMVRLALIHEAIHGLNDEWWIALYKNFPVSDELAAKINEVRKQCGAMNEELQNATAQSYNVRFSPFNEPTYEACSPALPLMSWVESGEEAFRCVDESHMLGSARNYTHNSVVGHPYDDATELASSAATVLYLDPGYMKRCFEEMGDEGLQLKQYVRAVLDISFYHQPELEKVLRHNELTSRTIDYLFTY